MKTMKLTKEMIEAQIKYEEAEGQHTFTMCRCGRNGCRGSLCSECWKEKLKQFTEGKE